MATNPFYTEMQGVATDLLTQFGNPSYLKYIGPATGGTRDPDFGSTTGSQRPDPVNLVGVVVGIEKKYVDGVTIKETDQMLVCDSQIVIEQEGKLEVGGRTWTILRNLPINPAGQLIVQKVAIRG